MSWTTRVVWMPKRDADGHRVFFKIDYFQMSVTRTSVS